MCFYTSLIIINFPRPCQVFVKVNKLTLFHNDTNVQQQPSTRNSTSILVLVWILKSGEQYFEKGKSFITRGPRMKVTENFPPRKLPIPVTRGIKLFICQFIFFKCFYFQFLKVKLTTGVCKIVLNITIGLDFSAYKIYEIIAALFGK